MAEYGLLLDGVSGGTSDWEYTLHHLTSGPGLWWFAGGVLALSLVFWFMR
ncbi:hypothetical protein [Aestuariicoccus sp. MJ-SS9]|nr:hypothetical protein [Aestuariicoccus sp. MJ-SS9]MDU8913858.1 hypothetical protein [Aestuariicoccus sp. MJ-SS9]